MANILGIGCKFEYEDGSSWVEVPNCTSISFPELTRSDIDITNHDVENFGKLYFPGLVEAGAVTVECLFTADLYSTLHGLFLDRDNQRNFRVTSPTGEEFTSSFAGYVNKVSPMFELEAHPKISMQVKVNGVPEVEVAS